MARRRGELFAQGAVTVLAFGIGLLVGAEHCAEPPAPVPPPQAVVCPEPAPCTTPPGPAPSPVRARKVRAGKRLPVAPAVEARHREQLLAWATERAAELSVCGLDPTGAIHVAVILHLSDEGAVERVEISRDPGELPPAQGACLRGRMRRWVPPRELVGGRDRLVFGLAL